MIGNRNTGPDPAAVARAHSRIRHRKRTKLFGPRAATHAEASTFASDYAEARYANALASLQDDVAVASADVAGQIVQLDRWGLGTAILEPKDHEPHKPRVRTRDVFTNIVDGSQAVIAAAKAPAKPTADETRLAVTEHPPPAAAPRLRAGAVDVIADSMADANMTGFQLTESAQVRRGLAERFVAEHDALRWRFFRWAVFSLALVLTEGFYWAQVWDNPSYHDLEGGLTATGWMSLVSKSAIMALAAGAIAIGIRQLSRTAYTWLLLALLPVLALAVLNIASIPVLEWGATKFALDGSGVDPMLVSSGLAAAPELPAVLKPEAKLATLEWFKWLFLGFVLFSGWCMERAGKAWADLRVADSRNAKRYLSAWKRVEKHDLPRLLKAQDRVRICLQKRQTAVDLCRADLAFFEHRIDDGHRDDKLVMTSPAANQTQSTTMLKRA